MRKNLPVLLLLAACQVDEPATATDEKALDNMEGMFDYAVDLPWRMEPRIVNNYITYDPVPITIVFHDEDTNPYSNASARIHNFCKLEVSRFRDGEASDTRTYLPGNLEWIELTGADPADANRPTYWRTAEEGGGEPYHAVCHPGVANCDAFTKILDTSEWHALVKWDPGSALPGDTEILKFVVTVSGSGDCNHWKKIKLENYARVYWGADPLPRFGGDGWLYGDLHYHAQSTDNDAEAGYSYRAVSEAMGAMGIDFTFATDHASNSSKIVNISGIAGGLDEDHRGLRDLNQTRWDSAMRTLHDPGGANEEVASSWPVSRPRIPRLFLGSEVDVVPEVNRKPASTATSDPAWSLPYGNDNTNEEDNHGRKVDLQTWFLDGVIDIPFVDELDDSTIPIIFQQATDIAGQTEYLLNDIQGLNAKDFGRQHILYLPRYTDRTNAHVPSNTGRYGGGSRRLVETDKGLTGVLPEIASKQGIAFLAHPNANGGGDKGPGILPYTDYQYAKIFGQQSFTGLQLWNENQRFSSAGGDYDIDGYSFAGEWDSGTHEYGWQQGEYRFVPMYDLKRWGWGRVRFNVDEALHNGTYSWDKLLRWGLDRGRTQSIAWLAGDPRRLFMAGGSDAHGDFNYRREGYLRGTTEANDTHFAGVRNLVAAGDPQAACSSRDPKCPGNPVPALDHSQDQIVGAIAEGKFSVTDGPAVRIVVDRNRNGLVDDTDYPMGSIVELYTTNGLDIEPLPILVEWQSTPEFGVVDRVDLYVGVDDDTCPNSPTGNCPIDATRARTYAPTNHGTRRDAAHVVELERERPPQDVADPDPAAVSCSPFYECKMADGYWLPGVTARSVLHAEPNTLHGVHTATLDLRSFPSTTRVTTRAYVRAFVRTRAPCDPFTAPRVDVTFNGECKNHFGFTNPVWAMRKQLPAVCPFNPRAANDRDFDELPDICDANPDMPDNHGVTRAFGGSTGDETLGVAFDGSFTYAAGSVTSNGRIENDGTTVTNYTATNVDALLVQYNATDTYTRRLQATGSGFAAFDDVATDTLGNVYVVGHFNGPMQLGSFSATATDVDGFVAKVRASDFAVQWVVRLGGVGAARATHVAVTDTQVAIAGDFTGTMTNAGTLVSEGAADCFVVRLSPLGILQNAQRVGGTGDCTATGIALEATGRSYLAANYGGAIRVGTTARTTTSRDSVVVRFGSWAELYAPIGTSWLGDPASSANDAFVQDVAVRAGVVVAAGYFRGSLSAATELAPFATIGASAGGRDGFVLRIATSNGAVTAPPVWRFGGTAEDSLNAVAVDPDGNVLVGGWFQSPTLATSIGALTRTSSADGMFFMLAPTGQVVWQRDFGTTGTHAVAAAAFSSNGRLAIGGTFQGQARIDDRRAVTTSGADDGFIAVFRTP